MRLFVTGGAGFLGSRVVARLLAADHSVVCLVRAPHGARDLMGLPGASDRLTLLYGSLQDTPDLRGAISGCDRIVHMAAAVKGHVSTLFLETVVGTRALVSACKSSGIERFLLISSIAVYDSQALRPREILDEGCPIDPHPHLRDPYTYSKLVQENICWDAQRRDGLPLVVLRPGVIYGPGRPVITPRVGLVAGRVLIRMGGRHPLPYTYVDNCADAVYLAAVDRESSAGQVVNIVDDQLPTGRQLVAACRRRGMPLRTIPVPAPMIPFVVGMYEWYSKVSRELLPPVLTRYRGTALWRPFRYSNARAKIVLNWKPRVPSVRALEHTLESLPTGINR